MDLHFWVKIFPNFSQLWRDLTDGTYCLGRGGRRGSRACRFPSPRRGRSPGETSRRGRWPERGMCYY